MVCELVSLKWSPDRAQDSVFSRLFNMVKDYDPIVWIKVFSSVLHTIDRELRCDDSIKIPLAIVQALNDISILAVCVRETWKHYNFDSEVLSSIQDVNKLETWGKQQPRPWLALSENSCTALGEDQCRKLEIYMHREDVEPHERMHSFWTVIDHNMKDSAGHEIFRFIQQRAPINPLPIHPESGKACREPSCRFILDYSDAVAAR